MLRHQSVFIKEAIDALCIKPHGIYVDATFGRGGHSMAILEHVRTGRVIAFDKDAEAIAFSEQHPNLSKDARLTLVHACFSKLKAELAALGVTHVDGILFDLGVSSPMLDDAARGFSFRFEGPLDMRMDTSQKLTAADVVANHTEAQLADIFKTYGEERHAKRLARAIVEARPTKPFKTTKDLSDFIANLQPSHEHKHPATRVFQALRIYVNQELLTLEQTLEQALDVLNPHGRLVAISFHSLEDRIVKQFIAKHSKPAPMPRGLPILEKTLPGLKLRALPKHLPSREEVRCNPRARSAVLRTAERLDA